MSMSLIATQTVGVGGAASITFSNIPQGYTHLQARIFARGELSFSAGLTIYSRMNLDSGANYMTHGLFGEGSATYSSALTGRTSIELQQAIPDSSKTSGIFGYTIVDILDYTNTNKYKVIKAMGGWDANGSGRTLIYSSAWLSTAAINTLFFSTDSNLSQGTTITLYGLYSSSVTGA